MVEILDKRKSLKYRPRLTSFVEPPLNPFVHKLHLTKLQKFQIAFMTVTIVPIRVVLVLLTFILTWFLSLFFTAGMTVPFQKPASSFRLMLCNIIRKLARLGLFFYGFHKIEFRGTRASSKEAPIIVLAPHTSMFDMFVICALSGPIPSSVSMIKILDYSYGAISKAYQPVYVARDDTLSKRKSLLEIKRRISEPGKWPQICVFPEGCCTNRKALISFKYGAFIPGCSVQPIVIEYLNDMDSFVWTEAEIPAFNVLWWSLCQWSSKMRVTYLPVYQPNQEEKSNAKLYANNVRQVMAKVLGVPTTDHTFEDSRLMRKALALNLPLESGAVEFTKMNQKLGMNIDTIHEKLKEFSNIACKDEGVITLESFAKFLKMPVCDAVKDLFYLYDRNDSGSISFRNYLLGFALVSKSAATEDTVKLAFNVFDKNHTGAVCKETFNEVLHAVLENEINAGSDIYDQIDKAHPDRFTYEELHEFAKKRPEYAKIFLWYKEMITDISSYSKLKCVNFSTDIATESPLKDIRAQQNPKIRQRKKD